MRERCKRTEGGVLLVGKVGGKCAKGGEMAGGEQEGAWVQELGGGVGRVAPTRGGQQGLVEEGSWWGGQGENAQPAGAEGRWSGTQNAAPPPLPLSKQRKEMAHHSD